MKNFLLASAAIVLAACSAGSPAYASATIDISKLETFTVADLTAAKADADAHNDTFASECYAGALVQVQALGGSITLPAPVGAASTFQLARDGVKLAQSGGPQIPPALVQACGPLALDVNNDLAKGGLTVFGLHL